jgi:transcriptional regulator with XRE-family HTH domain
MTTGERVIKLLEKQGKTKTQLAVYTGLTSSTISDWTGVKKTNPRNTILPKIAEFLNTSVDYLLTGKETENTFYLSDEEKEIIENFNILDNNDRKKALQYIRLLSTEDKYSKTNVKE